MRDLFPALMFLAIAVTDRAFTAEPTVFSSLAVVSSSLWVLAVVFYLIVQKATRELPLTT
jgi:hypothetical protein